MSRAEVISAELHADVRNALAAADQLVADVMRAFDVKRYEVI